MMNFDIMHMTFRGKSYVRDELTNFKYAWRHPIITCRLCIKYFYKWLFSLQYAFSPAVHRYFVFFFALVLRSFLWIYIGMSIGIITNNKSDGMRFVTEIPMTALTALMVVFGLMMVIRIVISFLEIIRLFKEDNLFLSGLGTAVVYGLIAMVFLGSALG